MYALAAFLLCVDFMVMLSVCEVSCSGVGWRGMSDVYILKSVGDRMPT